MIKALPSWSKCRFRQKEICRRFIQGFSKIATPLTSMLRTSSSTDSSTSAAQIVFEYDEVGSGGGKLIKKFSKVEKSTKSKTPQRPEKSAKTIGLEDLSFLTSDARLAFTKIGSSCTKLTIENYWLSLKLLRIGRLQAQSSGASQS